MNGLIGKKVGMTRIFTDTEMLSVTVISVAGNRVAQVKTAANDGYDAVQLAFGDKKVKNLDAAQRGHRAKYQVGAAARLREFPVATAGEDIAAGTELSADIFSDGQYVDIVGTSKGKGFAGVIKRHHFAANRSTHGNSRAHRKGGSTGQCQDPGRTFPGKKMPGRLGGKRCTAQNLRVARVDAERNLLWVRGNVPGAPGDYVLVQHAVKKRKQA